MPPVSGPGRQNPLSIQPRTRKYTWISSNIQQWTLHSSLNAK